MHKRVRPADTDKVANLAQYPKNLGTAGLMQQDLHLFTFRIQILQLQTVASKDERRAFGKKKKSTNRRPS